MTRLSLTLIALLLAASVARAESVTVTATWENPPAGAPATRVVVERSVDDGTLWSEACTAAPEVKTCSDSPQPFGATYLYRIVWENTFGRSDPTSPFSVTASRPNVGGGLFTYSVNPNP